MSGTYCNFWKVWVCASTSFYLISAAPSPLNGVNVHGQLNASLAGGVMVAAYPSDGHASY